MVTYYLNLSDYKIKNSFTNKYIYKIIKKMCVLNLEWNIENDWGAFPTLEFNSFNDSPINTTLQCKKCFVGECSVNFTKLKNLGGKGRFIIMSKIDWCSSKIEVKN